ncbi:hypothetical protein BH24ACT3_BH24ACT3_00380 [soil metagenome]
MGLLAALVAVTALAPAAGAATDGDVTLEAEVDGRAVRGVGSNNAIEVGSRPQAALRLTVINGTDQPLDLAEVRLEGTALGVTFLSYDAVVPVVVDPGESRSFDVVLPIRDITDQTIGLVPSSIGLYDTSGARVADQSFTLDVDGSVGSIFGVLGILIALFTVSTMLMNLWLVLRRRMPPNRLSRGIRFAVPGAGLGLLVCITLAGLRVVAPYPSIWPPLVLGPAVVAFILGFLSPGALSLEEDEVDVALRDRELATTGERA